MEIAENGLVTSDGTKVLTVEEFDRLKNSIHKTAKALFGYFCMCPEKAY